MSANKPANPILLAASKVEPAIVSAILAHRMAPKIDLNERDESDCSAVGHLAQKIRDAEETRQAIESLIAAGAKIDELEPDMEMRGDWSSASGKYERPKVPLALLSLRKYSSPWKPIMEALGPKKLKGLSADWPLLHEALARSNQACAEMLLAAGADPNREDNGFGFPISQCATPALFSMMVSAGAKLGLADAKGRTALQAVSSSNVSAEILSMAATAAQAEAKGSVASFKEGQTSKAKASDDIAQPLIEALFDAIDSKKPDRVKNLWATLNLGRDKGRLTEARDHKGRSLLHAAISRRNFALAKRLIGRGLDVNAFDDKDNTPATLLMTLNHDHRAERGDRYGDRRAKFFGEVAPLIVWSAKSARGADYFEVLFIQALEQRNGSNVTPQAVAQKALAAPRDWLEVGPSGEDCLLSRILQKAYGERYHSNQSIFRAVEEGPKPLPMILAEQIERPEFSALHAKAILTACFSESQRSMASPSGWQRKVADAIEANLDAFKRTGVDPESIAWNASMPSALPTLASAIESWRLSAVSQKSEVPKTRAKSL